jgi:Spermidine synthase
VSPHRSLIPLHIFLFLSGAAGLGYQMVWTRMLAVGLGHEIVAVLAVVAAFFAGVAVGAWVLDGRISRSLRPGRWYAGLEATIGLWSLALTILIPIANEHAATLIGVEPTPARHWGIAFLLPFLLLLPATAAMGATLPAMERLVFRLRQGGQAVGGLYAANTAGAVGGTIVTTLWIAPAVGFTATLLLLAAANGICAVGALLVEGRAGRGSNASTPRSATAAAESHQGGRRLFAILLATGFLGIGYEVLIVRMLSQILENTIYSFAAVLVIYLLGTALGGTLYQLFRPRRDFDRILAVLLLALSAACVAGTASLLLARPLYDALRDVTAADLLGGVTAELAVATLVLFVPTVLMGATFSHVAQRIRDARDRLGHAVAVNTLGAAAAPLVFGVGLLPAIGSKAALLAVAAGYLPLVPPTGRWRWAATAAIASAAVLFLVATADFRFVEVPEGGDIVSHDEGVMAAVSVVSDSRGYRFLKVNDEFRMGSTASVYSDRRQADVPLLLHPHPRRALFLGLGPGATLAGVLDHPGLDAVGVELVPEVVDAMPYFDEVLDGLRGSDRVRIVVADARRYVQATREPYDVIVADVYHPSRDGTGSLYTAEHFTAIRDRLAPGGLFCQWLPLYQLDAPTLRTIIRTFLTVFPDATGYLAHYSLLTPMLCLVGSREPRHYPADWYETRVDDPRLAAALKRIDLDTDFALFGTFVGGPADLARFAGDGPINTDDRPVVTFAAPLAVYHGLAPPWGRLASLVHAMSPKPADVMTDAAPGDAAADFDQRLAAYWQGRNAFLSAGTTVRPSADPRVMAQQISGPLLAIVRTSPDFESAYRPLLALARDLSRVDPAAAGRLLIDLDRANPRRDDARHLYAQLFAAGRPSVPADGGKGP